MMGVPKLYNCDNPLEFMDMINMQCKTNFFESRVTEYKKARVGQRKEDYIFTTDAHFWPTAHITQTVEVVYIITAPKVYRLAINRQWIIADQSRSPAITEGNSMCGSFAARDRSIGRHAVYNTSIVYYLNILIKAPPLSESRLFFERAVFRTSC